jgi:predicted nuclease of predicted toxin-antitoxin system
MNILVDMNLSPSWVPFLRQQGFVAEHWSRVGPFNAPDRDIMAWAGQQGYVILTHDLDFGSILAATSGDGPSVVQLRMQDVLPGTAGPAIVQAILQNEALIAAGALLSIESSRRRIRALPLRR